MAGFVGCGHQDRGRAVANGRTHHASEWVRNEGRGKNLFDRAPGLILGMRVQTPVGVVLGGDAGKLFLCRAVALHMLAGEVGIVIHKNAAGLTGPRALLAAHLSGKRLGLLKIDGAAYRLKRALLIRVKELFHPEREHNVIHPGRDVEPSQMKGGGRAGARVFGINDRDAANAELAQHDLTPDTLLSGNQAGHRIPNDRGLDIRRADPCRVYGAFNRLPGPNPSCCDPYVCQSASSPLQRLQPVAYCSPFL